MKFLLSVSIFVLGGLQAHAQGSCVPSYQVEQEPCVETDKVSGFKTVAIGPVRIVDAACEPDARVLCEGHPKSAVIAGLRGVSASDVQLKKYDAKTAIGKFCKFGVSKQDVFCTWEAKAPKYELVTDATCPILSVADANNCYKKEEVALDVSIATNCMNQKPENDVQIWQKAACMLDAYKSADSVKGMTVELYDQLKLKLKVMKDQAARKSDNYNMIKLVQYLNTEMK